jgi:hypothetical protein
MTTHLRLLNHSLLFLCVSMYLGTGWSLLLFTFPIAPELTPDNYYMQFVPQVTAATEFFTYMTILMLGNAGVMIWSEWKTSLRWPPIVVLLGVIAATQLTRQFILPLNAEMASHIKSAERLGEVLHEWMGLNRVRVALWTIQWAAMMFWFYSWSRRGKHAT